MFENLGPDGWEETGQDSMTACGRDPPLDLVHLARQCQGDYQLEEELLGLFRLQSRALAAQLSDSRQGTLESTARIAHKLRGSALAVGARRVAGAAQAVEALASSASDRVGPRHEHADVTRAVETLEAAVAEAASEIQRICG